MVLLNCQDFLSTWISFSTEMIYTENTGIDRVPNNPWPWYGLLLYAIQRQYLEIAHEWFNLKVEDRVFQVFEHSEVFDQTLFIPGFCVEEGAVSASWCKMGTGDSKCQLSKTILAEGKVARMHNYFVD